ncbi:MAG: 50S ribosomal protein L33 [Parcubacteria group bacterium]|nr:50S ribosomal protein L33 [Parcubacteria group bacterium]
MSQENLIRLQCGVCKRANYYVNKSVGKKSGEKKEKKLALNKFCKWCRKHTIHKELKITG